jgi:arsenite methyltransferase
MNVLNEDQIRQNVRSRYKQIALQEVGANNCCAADTGCCDTPADFNAESGKLGYSTEELSAALIWV